MPPNETRTDDSVEADLRRLLWLNHGCPIGAIYADDGEMQCGMCGVDFRRDATVTISAKWLAARSRKEPVKP